MEELNIVKLTNYQEVLSNRLAEGNLSDAERKATLTELKVIEDILNKFLNTQAEFDKIDLERDKAEIEREMKTLEIEKKLEIETMKAKIEADKVSAEITKAQVEANKVAIESRKLDLQEKEMELTDRQKRADRRVGLLDTVLKTFGSLGGSVVVAAASIVSVGRILHAEENDILAISKAIQFVLKPKS